MGFLTFLHIVVAIILILLVLVQDSKGAMGSTFGGGGSNTLFGATGMDNALTRATKVIVVVFAITCILLTRLSSQNRESVLDIEGHRPTQPQSTIPDATSSQVPEASPQNETSTETDLAESNTASDTDPSNADVDTPTESDTSKADESTEDDTPQQEEGILE